MKKLLLSLLSLFVLFGYTHAFTPDNTLLSKLYDQVDAVYEKQPERLLKLYEKLSYLELKYAHKPDVAYYLTKMHNYIHGKLFTFDEQPNFVCRENYIQKGDTVEIDYTIKKLDGSLLSTTLLDVAREYGWSDKQLENILAFNPWMEQVMPWMDSLVLWSRLGQRKASVVEAKDAYGSYNTGLVMTFSGTKIPVEIQATALDQKVLLTMQIDGENKTLLGKVVQKTATTVVVDFNHSYAWEDIALTIQILKLFKQCK